MDEIVNNIEFEPIVIGAVISIVLILIGQFTFGYLHLFAVIIGSAVAGFMSRNPTKYALIYGAIIGIVSSFLMLTVFTIPLYLILGLFGGFIGKVLQANN